MPSRCYCRNCKTNASHVLLSCSGSRSCGLEMWTLSLTLIKFHFWNCTRGTWSKGKRKCRKKERFAWCVRKILMPSSASKMRTCAFHGHSKRVKLSWETLIRNAIIFLSLSLTRWWVGSRTSGFQRVTRSFMRRSLCCLISGYRLWTRQEEKPNTLNRPNFWKAIRKLRRWIKREF